jgi:hypothetical protein
VLVSSSDEAVSVEECTEDENDDFVFVGSFSAVVVVLLDDLIVSVEEYSVFVGFSAVVDFVVIDD